MLSFFLQSLSLKQKIKFYDSMVACLCFVKHVAIACSWLKVLTMPWLPQRGLRLASFGDSTQQSLLVFAVGVSSIQAHYPSDLSWKQIQIGEAGKWPEVRLEYRSYLAHNWLTGTSPVLCW